MLSRNNSVFLLFIFSAFVSFSQKNETRTEIKSDSSSKVSAFPNGEQFKGANITFKIIPAAKNTFCYDIFMEGKLFIHQPSAPGLPGNEGFKTEAAAIRVAELVISKMKRGEMPPSITIEEMKQLNALDKI